MQLIILLLMGVGDGVFVEPGIRYLLDRGLVTTIHIFMRPDALGLYHNYPNVRTYPHNARSTLQSLQQKCPNMVTLMSGLDQAPRIVDFARALCHAVGAELLPDFDPVPRLPVSATMLEWAERYVNSKQGQLCLLVQMEASRQYKSLPRQTCMNILHQLLDRNVRVLALTNRMVDVFKHPNLKWIRGLSIERFMGICSYVDRVISHDSAPAWIAGAVGTETIALFGPTDPYLYNIFAPHVKVLQTDGKCGIQPCNQSCVMPTDRPCLAFPPEVLLEAAITGTVVGPVVELRPYQAASLLRNSKPAIPDKPHYKLVFVVPHIFIGGGETQLQYLINALLVDYPDLHIELIITGQVDQSLYPILQKLVSCKIVNGPQQLGDALVTAQADVVIYHNVRILKAALRHVPNIPVVIQIVHTGLACACEDITDQMEEYIDHVITVADWLRKRLLPGREHIPIRTVLNGVPVTLPTAHRDLRSEHRIPEQAIVVGSMSRFDGGKGTNLLIDAMALAPANVYLLLAGWGAHEEALRSRARQYGNRVIFAGLVEDRKAFFQAVQICALASPAEGNSMFLLESAMAKRAIITTPVGAVPELFEDEQSALFVDRTAKSIAAAMHELTDNPSFRHSLEHNAYQIVKAKATSRIMAGGYMAVVVTELLRRSAPETILCFREWGLGDVVMTTPAISYLRRTFPQAQITYLVKEQHRSLLECNPDIDVLLTVTDQVHYSKLYPQYQVCYNFVHQAVAVTRQHIIDHNLGLVGATEISQQDRELTLVPEQIDLSLQSPYLCLATTSSYRCKNWGTGDDWRHLVQFLQERYQVVVLGDGPSYGGTKLSSVTPRQAAAVLENAAFLISVDSFAIHAARAVGCPTIAIYGGASDPEICGYSENLNITAPFGCRCDMLYMPRGSVRCKHNHRCLESISIEMLIEAITRMEDAIQSKVETVY